MLAEPYRLFGASMKSAPEIYYDPTMGVNLADISPHYPDPTYETNEAMTSDVEVNNTKQAGGYAAELKAIDELSTALSSATEHHAGSSNEQMQHLGIVQVSQIIKCFLGLSWSKLKCLYQGLCSPFTCNEEDNFEGEKESWQKEQDRPEFSASSPLPKSMWKTVWTNSRCATPRERYGHLRQRQYALYL